MSFLARALVSAASPHTKDVTVNRFVVAVFSSCFVFGCATSSSANYDVRYATAGAATETAALNSAASEAFREDPSELAKQQIAAIKVFIDTVPPELSVTNAVVSVARGSSARMVGSVELFAKWKTPTEEEVLPAMQKAAYAASANLAFCPRNATRRYAAWRCYLVKTSAAPTPEATSL